MKEVTEIVPEIKEEAAATDPSVDSSKILKTLSQSIADEDLKMFKETLNIAIHSNGNVSCLAKNAGLSRGTLYKVMSEGSDTGLSTILKLFHALGLELVVVKRSGKAKRHVPREMSEKKPIWKKFVSFFSREE